jgi:glycosyltransferase involved in cell wall biosynthesis
MSNSAIYFHPDGYVTNRADLKGRHVAGESFLTGFLRHAGSAELVCCAEDEELAAGFYELAQRHAPGRPVRLVTQDRLERLSEPGCLFIPGANIEQFAWSRRRVGQRTYSLCGVTHTTAENPSLCGGLLTGPIQPWDAVICASESARSSVEAVLLPYADYLRHRLGATRLPMPRLPVIPLGIDTAYFRPVPGVREEERQKLGLGPDDIAVLFVGRLSFHAKAHPIPMYMALQKAAQRTGRRLHLIQAGWFGHEEVARGFIEGARRYCPDVNVIFVDGREPATRQRIWAAGDIFTSLVDNVQETFGLTPVEAMAAGLPCVISDWNGYRETVRDGIDGFRVPTLMPPVGTGWDLADRYARGFEDYDHYIGRSVHMIAVDVEAAAEAYAKLAEDAGLRRSMGAAAQARAAEFDWSAIIPRYQQLWAELAELRGREAEIAPWPGHQAMPPQSHPLWPDPMAMFAAYPTDTLDGASRLVRTPEASSQLLADLIADPLNSLADSVISPRQDLELALQVFSPPAGRDVASLLAQLSADRRLRMVRSLVYLVKFGLLRVLV